MLFCDQESEKKKQRKMWEEDRKLKLKNLRLNLIVIRNGRLLMLSFLRGIQVAVCKLGDLMSEDDVDCSANLFYKCRMKLSFSFQVNFVVYVDM